MLDHLEAVTARVIVVVQPCNVWPPTWESWDSDFHAVPRGETMPRTFTRTARLAATMTVVLCALGALPAAAQFAENTQGPIQSMTALSANDFQCRTSTFPGEDRLAEIPNTSLDFELGGFHPQSVLVTFSANWPIPKGSNLPLGSVASGAIIFLFIDDDRFDIISENGGVLVHEGTATSVSNGTHGFTFATRPLAPGAHTAKIFWSNNILVGTGSVCVFDRSLVVQHR
jgi:hypothetical protein